MLWESSEASPAFPSDHGLRPSSQKLKAWHTARLCHCRSQAIPLSQKENHLESLTADPVTCRRPHRIGDKFGPRETSDSCTGCLPSSALSSEYATA